MFARLITHIATATIGAATIGLAAVAAAGTAGAGIGTLDDAFLDQINGRGIALSTPEEAVSRGHLVCTELAAGESGQFVLAKLRSQTNLSPKRASYFASSATQTYCPEFSAQLTK